MSCAEYTKPFLSYDEQLNLLQERGLIVKDRTYAVEKLKLIGFNKFRDYAYHCLCNKKYIENSNFNAIYLSFQVDSLMRVSIFSLIEKIELSFKEQFCHYFTDRFGSDFYRNETLFKNKNDFANLQSLINKEVLQSKERHIRNLCEKYTLISLPFWAVKDVLTFGTISKMFKNLIDISVKKQISKFYTLDYDTLTSWLEHLTYLRNQVAHQGRLINKNLTILPKKTSIKPKFLNQEFVDGGKIYNSIIILLYLTLKFEDRMYIESLINVLETNTSILSNGYGFPSDWQSRPIWKEAMQ